MIIKNTRQILSCVPYIFLFSLATVSFIIPSSAAGAVSVDNVKTSDVNENGKIDRIIVEFSGAAKDNGMYRSGSDSNPGLITEDYDLVSVSGNNSDTLTYTIEEKSSEDTGASPSVTFDPDNFTDLSTSGAPSDASDGAPPAIMKAIRTSDTKITVTLSESVDRTQITSSTFTITEGSADDLGSKSITAIENTGSGNTVIITIVGPIKSSFGDQYGNTIKLSGKNVLKDPSGNYNSLSYPPEFSILASESGGGTNKKTVTVSKVITGDNDGDGFIDRLFITFSEGVTDTTDYEGGQDSSPGLKVTGYDVRRSVGYGLPTLTYLLEENSTPDTGATPTVSYNASKFENVNESVFGIVQSPSKADDGAPPAIAEAAVRSETEIIVVLTEPVKTETLQDMDFSFTDDSMNNLGDTAITNMVFLEVADSKTKVALFTIKGPITTPFSSGSKNVVKLRGAHMIEDPQGNDNLKYDTVTIKDSEDDLSEDVSDEEGEDPDEEEEEVDTGVQGDVLTAVAEDTDENGKLDEITITFGIKVIDRGVYKSGLDLVAGVKLDNEDYDIITHKESRASATQTYIIRERSEDDLGTDIPLHFVAKNILNEEDEEISISRAPKFAVSEDPEGEETPPPEDEEDTETPPEDELSGYDFPDTETNTWRKSIAYLKKLELIEGYADGDYKPFKKINRAEFTKIIIEGKYGDDVDLDLFIQDCFPDVKMGDWFSKYVCFAKATGILNGYPDGNFKPENTITEPEALKVILKAFGENIDTSSGQWYEWYLNHAAKIGMLYFQKENASEYEINRAEMAYFMAWLFSREDESLEEPVDQITSF